MARTLPFIWVFLVVSLLQAVCLSLDAGATDSDITGQIRKLNGSLPDERISAASALAKTGERAVICPLVRALADRDPGVRQAIATALEQFVDRRGVELIAALRQAADPKERDAIAAKIVEINDPRMVEAIVCLLVDYSSLLKEPYTGNPRDCLVGILAKLQADNTVQLLIDAMTHERVHSCRLNAAIALKRLQDPRTVDLIASLVRDGKGDPKKMAIEVLAVFKEQNAMELLTEAIGNSDASVRKEVVKAWREAKNSAALLPVMRLLPDGTPEVRKEVTALLRSAACGEDGWDGKEGAVAILSSKDPEWLKGLKETLDSSDDGGSVLRALGCATERALTAGSTETLVLAIRTGAWRKVVEELGRRKDPISVEPLISALGDKDEGARMAAAAALGEIGDRRALDFLITALQDEECSVRAAAARALGKLNDPRAVEPLISFLDAGNSRRDKKCDFQGGNDTKSGAAYSLILIGDPRGLEEVILVVSQNPYSFRHVLEALAKLFDQKKDLGPILVALKSSDVRFRRTAAHVMWLTKNPVRVNPLLSALRDGDREVRRLATQGLKYEQGSQVTEAILVLLKDPEKDVRKGALEALRYQWERYRGLVEECLGKLSDPDVADALIKARQDTSPSEQEFVRNAMGSFRHPAALERLVRVEMSRYSEEGRAAIKAFQAAKDPKVVDLLVATVNDRKTAKATRKQAIWYLLETQDPARIPTLIRASKDRDEEIRWEAVAALQNIQDAKAEAALADALKDKAQEVRRQAATGLANMKSLKAVPGLVAALKDKDERVRREAVEVLSDIKSKDSVPALIAALTDSDTEVREQAAKTLGSIGDKRGVKALVENLTDWRCGPTVAEALSELSWSPKTDREKIHFFVANRSGEDLREDIALTKRVLFADMDSGNARRTENAVFALISLGDTGLIPVLIKKLKTRGSKVLAEAYLNCGQDELAAAAEEWSKSRGYRINRGVEGAPAVSWGQM